MAQLANIAVGTPTVTFTPLAAQRQSDTPARLVIKNAANPSASEQLEILVRYPTGNQVTERVRLKDVLPQTAEVNGITTVTSQPYAAIEFVFDSSVSVAQRTLLRKRIIDLLGHASVIDAIDNGSPLI